MDELPEGLATASGETDPVDSLADCLPRVLSELAPDDREAITLCDLGGMPQEEFARLKGLSLPGAKSRVQRARKRPKGCSKRAAWTHKNSGLTFGSRSNQMPCGQVNPV